MRKKSGEIRVTAQAPASEPSIPTAAAGIMARQGSCTLRPYCQAEMAVPQTEALLLVPSKKAGGVLG